MSGQDTSADQPERMCPSTPVSNATVFLGMITSARRVAYVTPAVPAETVLDSLPEGAGSLESRYRLAGPCVTSGCGYWAGDHCGLGARLAAPHREADAVELPKCAIRRTCRWFSEQGPAACAACSTVITDRR